MSADPVRTRGAERATVSRPALMSGGSDAAFRGFLHNLLAFSARLDDIRSGFGALIGLTGIGYTTLISIGHLQGEAGVGVAALAAHLHLSGAFVTIEVNKLVARGLVEKRVNDSDRRRVLLTLTPAGQERLDGLATVQAPVNDALFASLGADDFRRLDAMVATLIGDADNARALQALLTRQTRSLDPAAAS